MKIVTINLSKTANLVGYLHDVAPNVRAGAPRPAIVLCPGGGYQHLSPRESDPVALEFFAHGYQVFIVSYSILEAAQNFQPLKDVSNAMTQVRKNAEAYHLIPDKIALMGFSAGGHVCANLATLWDHETVKALTGTADGSNRPNALVLGYPVITMGQFTHPGSAAQLTGGRAEPDTLALLSAENHVSAQTPPTFLWHTVSDQTVPVENSLLFVNALQRAGVSFELHIFPHGSHGLSLCNKEVGTPNKSCAVWVALCKTWLDDLFGFTA